MDYLGISEKDLTKMADVEKAKKKEKQKGLPSRAGKRGYKYSKYFSDVMPTRKLRNLLKHNGLQAAKDWAEVYGYHNSLRKLRDEMESRAAMRLVS